MRRLCEGKRIVVKCFRPRVAIVFYAREDIDTLLCGGQNADCVVI